MGSGSRTTVPVDSPPVSEGPTAPMDEAGGANADTLDSIDTSSLNPARKARGMAVAIGLLVVLVALAGWYGYRMFRN